jgi:hypothetical protein
VHRVVKLLEELFVFLLSALGGKTQRMDLLDADLYVGSARCAPPLPRGFSGHVAHPIRSIH